MDPVVDGRVAQAAGPLMRSSAPAGYPAHIEKTYRAYLECGLLRNGFARVRCDACGVDADVSAGESGG